MIQNGTMADKETPITPIPTDSCWGYLASQEVGRLATTVLNMPEIFPVNFCLDGESIVFRTAAGTKLETLTDNRNVVFEVDGWNDEGGWSVVVHGTAEVISAEEELARAVKMPLRPWVPTLKKNFVRITPDLVTGRSFYFGPEQA